jgi:hypothetical protein
MKSAFALAALSFTAATVTLSGCSAAPDSAIAEGEDAFTVRDVRGTVTPIVSSTGTVTAPTISVTASSTPTTSPSRVYTFPTDLLGGKCVARRGTTGFWKATLLGDVGVLRGQCVLEWIGSGTPDVMLLPSNLRDDAAKRVFGDSPVVAPLASAFVDTSWKTLSKFRALMAGTDGAPVQTRTSAAFVAVIDSSKEETASDEASIGSYEHGELVGRIVRETGGATSALAVLSTTGLPRQQDGSYTSGGGYYGYTSDVALAVVRAVNAWRSRTATERVKRPLVVNLSLGWDTAAYTGTPLDATGVLSTYAATNVANVPQRSVFLALQYANCAGALVLSAAGNKAAGSPSTTTLMLPAAWEAVPAPTATQCSTSFGITPIANRVETSPRMTYAIGGVDGADRDLFNTRPAGQPRMVAYGDLVAASRAPAFGGHTGIMTGTSIATAVASGIAAYAWSFSPSTSAHDVAWAMYDQGRRLSPRATACSFGANCLTRRVGLCETAAKLRGVSASCSSPAAYAQGKVSPGFDPTSLDVRFESARQRTMLAGATLTNEIVRPSARPMPGSGGCSLCGVYDGTAYLDISNPTSAIGAQISWGSFGYSFTPESQYIALPLSTFASFGTITFTDWTSGWTSTEQLVLF